MQPGGPAHVILILIHVIAAVTWLAQFPIDLIMSRLVKINQGKPNEATLMATHLRLGNAMGSVAGPLVLLSGFGLLYVWRFGFFGLTANTPPWLIVKQVVYVILFVLLLTVIAPNAKRIGPLVGQLMQGAATTGVTDDQRSAYHSISNVSRISAALVLLNIILGVWQSPEVPFNLPSAPSAAVSTDAGDDSADTVVTEEAAPTDAAAETATEAADDTAAETEAAEEAPTEEATEEAAG
jgi:hypothetical protein